MSVMVVHALPEDELLAFGKAVEAVLPTGGEPPALVVHLPESGKQEKAPIYFHQELSIQDEVWLGGENMLGLSAETEGVLAFYTLSGSPVKLLVIRYPNQQAAQAGRAALQPDLFEDLAAVEQRQALLGAVLGRVDEGAARTLLVDALKHLEGAN